MKLLFFILQNISYIVEKYKKIFKFILFFENNAQFISTIYINCKIYIGQNRKNNSYKYIYQKYNENYL